MKLSLNVFVVITCSVIIYPLPTLVSGNCVDNDKIITASVLGTLGVEIVIAVIAFFVWKKCKAKKKQQESLKVNNDFHGHDNGAFSPNMDVSAAEEGLGNQHELPKKAKKIKSPSQTASPNEKSWNSFPGVQFTGLNFARQGSCASLDNNITSQEPEIASVNLRSQDFIGLGFNISGSMRDGIYITEIHNRGPAIESGVLKVGDRILSVTISFENMVFEDALTILSYASPYPVNICVQKHKAHTSSYKVNGFERHLSHPLYRSQSLDALTLMNRQTLPKRRNSDLKFGNKNPKDLDSSSLSRFSSSNNVQGETNLEIPSSIHISEVIIHKQPTTESQNEKNSLNPPLLQKEQNGLTNSVKLMEPYKLHPLEDTMESTPKPVSEDKFSSFDSDDSISKLDEKMDIHFSHCDKEFEDLKQKADEDNFNLNLDFTTERISGSTSPNSEKEFEKLEKKIKLSDSFTDLFDRLNDDTKFMSFDDFVSKDYVASRADNSNSSSKIFLTAEMPTGLTTENNTTVKMADESALTGSFNPITSAAPTIKMQEPTNLKFPEVYGTTSSIGLSSENSDSNELQTLPARVEIEGKMKEGYLRKHKSSTEENLDSSLGITGELSPVEAAFDELDIKEKALNFNVDENEQLSSKSYEANFQTKVQLPSLESRVEETLWGVDNTVPETTPGIVKESSPFSSSTTKPQANLDSTDPLVPNAKDNVTSSLLKTEVSLNAEPSSLKAELTTKDINPSLFKVENETFMSPKANTYDIEPSFKIGSSKSSTFKYDLETGETPISLWKQDFDTDSSDTDTLDYEAKTDDIDISLSKADDWTDEFSVSSLKTGDLSLSSLKSDNLSHSPSNFADFSISPLKTRNLNVSSSKAEDSSIPNLNADDLNNSTTTGIELNLSPLKKDKLNISSSEAVGLNLSPLKQDSLNVSTSKDVELNLSTLKTDDLSLATSNLNQPIQVISDELSDSTSKIVASNLSGDLKNSPSNIDELSESASKVVELSPSSSRTGDLSFSTPKAVELNLPSLKDDLSISTSKAMDLNLPSLKVSDPSLATSNAFNLNQSPFNIDDWSNSTSEAIDSNLPPLKSGDLNISIGKKDDLSLSTSEAFKMNLSPLKEDNLSVTTSKAMDFNLPSLKKDDLSFGTSKDVHLNFSTLKTYDSTSKVIDSNLSPLKADDLNISPSKAEDLSISTPNDADLSLSFLKEDNLSLSTSNVVDLNRPSLKADDLTLASSKTVDLNLPFLKTDDSSDSASNVIETNLSPLKTDDLNFSPSKTEDLSFPILKRVDLDPSHLKADDLSVSTSKVVNFNISSLKTNELSLDTLKDFNLNPSPLKTNDSTDSTSKSMDLNLSPLKADDLNISISKADNLSVSTSKAVDFNLPSLKGDDLSFATSKVVDLNLSPSKTVALSDSNSRIIDSNLSALKADDLNLSFSKAVDLKIKPLKEDDLKTTTSEVEDFNLPSLRGGDLSLATSKAVDFNITHLKEDNLNYSTSNELDSNLPPLKADDFNISTLKADDFSSFSSKAVDVSTPSLKGGDLSFDISKDVHLNLYPLKTYDSNLSPLRADDSNFSPSKTDNLSVSTPNDADLKFSLAKEDNLSLSTSKPFELSLSPLKKDNLNVSASKADDLSPSSSKTVDLNISILTTGDLIDSTSKVIDSNLSPLKTDDLNLSPSKADDLSFSISKGVGLNPSPLKADDDFSRSTSKAVNFELFPPKVADLSASPLKENESGLSRLETENLSVPFSNAKDLSFSSSSVAVLGTPILKADDFNAPLLQPDDLRLSVKSPSNIGGVHLSPSKTDDNIFPSKDVDLNISRLKEDDLSIPPLRVKDFGVSFPKTFDLDDSSLKEDDLKTSPSKTVNFNVTPLNTVGDLNVSSLKSDSLSVSLLETDNFSTPPLKSEESGNFSLNSDDVSVSPLNAVDLNPSPVKTDNFSISQKSSDLIVSPSKIAQLNLSHLKTDELVVSTSNTDGLNVSPLEAVDLSISPSKAYDLVTDSPSSRLNLKENDGKLTFLKPELNTDLSSVKLETSVKSEPASDKRLGVVVPSGIYRAEPRPLFTQPIKLHVSSKTEENPPFVENSRRESSTLHLDGKGIIQKRQNSSSLEIIEELIERKTSGRLTPYKYRFKGFDIKDISLDDDDDDSTNQNFTRVKHNLFNENRSEMEAASEDIVYPVRLSQKERSLTKSVLIQDTVPTKRSVDFAKDTSPVKDAKVSQTDSNVPGKSSSEESSLESESEEQKSDETTDQNEGKSHYTISIFKRNRQELLASSSSSESEEDTVGVKKNLTDSLLNQPLKAETLDENARSSESSSDREEHAHESSTDTNGSPQDLTEKEASGAEMFKLAKRDKGEEDVAKEEESQDKKDEAFFEMTEDEFSTDTQSLSPKSVVTRAISCDGGFVTSDESDLSKPKWNSLKRETKHPDQEDNYLDWSGKRLVRAGSFSRIPDSNVDWTESSQTEDDKVKLESNLDSNHDAINETLTYKPQEELTNFSLSCSSSSISSNETKPNGERGNDSETSLEPMDLKFSRPYSDTSHKVDTLLLTEDGDSGLVHEGHGASITLTFSAESDTEA